MSNIRLRIGSAWDRDPETGTYRDAAVKDAIAALRGEHGKNRYGQSVGADYHEGTPVYAVRVWEAETFVPAEHRGRVDATYHAGDPRFGEEVTIYPRGQSYSAPKAAYVSWSSFTGEPGEATAALELAAYATGLAQMANMKTCPACALEYAERQARRAAKEGEQS